MPAAKIVVTASFDSPAAEYLEAIREAGGEPLRADPSSEPLDVLAGADALLLTGGGDVAPERYGAWASALVSDVEPERDAFEIAVLWAAREQHLPVLCICRGIQVANVAFGGSLIADIPAALAERATVRHDVPGPDGRAERGLIAGHVVTLDASSRLAAVIGTNEVTTGARHHQAIERCADDLRVVGRTADGIVEAVEARFDAPFWLGVQWHPESTRELDDGASRALFAAFVAAARAHAHAVTA